MDGFLAGGQIGFNIQSGNLLICAEGDLSWSGIDGSGPGIPDPDELYETRVKRIATLTARLGYASNRWLLYVKGGGAWAWEQHKLSDGGALVAVLNERHSGWTVGAGLEHAIAENWSAKIEYNYFDFGRKSAAVNIDQVRIDQTMHAVKLGINYRFATGKTPASVVTKY